MFTIIAGVIGLGIAVALLIVGANYLGNAYTNSTAKAQATSLANLGQQVQGAIQLAVVETGTAPTSLAALAPAYLASVPTFSFAVVNDTITSNQLVATGGTSATPAAIAEKICEQVALIGGENVNAAVSLTAGARFGCITPAAGVKSFAYKVN